MIFLIVKLIPFLYEPINSIITNELKPEIESGSGFLQRLGRLPQDYLNHVKKAIERD
jgi:hypothetical protein